MGDLDRYQYSGAPDDVAKATGGAFPSSGNPVFLVGDMEVVTFEPISGEFDGQRNACLTVKGNMARWQMPEAGQLVGTHAYLLLTRTNLLRLAAYAADALEDWPEPVAPTDLPT